MKLFKMYKSKNGELYDLDTILSATSKYEALIKFSGTTDNIYFEGRQIFYNPFDNVRYIAKLHKN